MIGEVQLWRVGLPERTLVTLLLVLGLAGRVAGVLLYGDAKLDMEWNTYVKNLLAGHGFVFWSVDQSGALVHHFISEPQRLIPSAYEPPGYAFFLAGLALIVGIGKLGVTTIELLQAVLGIILCWLVYCTARRRISSQGALWTLALCCFYPILVYAPSQISSVNIYLPIFVAVVLLLVRWEDEAQWRDLIAAAILTGVLVLFQAQFLVYVPCIAVWLFFRSPKSRRIAPLVYLVCGLLVLSPWTARNYLLFGSFIPVRTGGGLNLWHGQSEHATGIAVEYAVPGLEDPLWPPELENQLTDLPLADDYEIRRDQVFMAAALEFMSTNFHQVLSLAVRKMSFFWSYIWIDNTYPGANSPFYLGAWFFVVPLMLIGLASTSSNWRKNTLFYMFFFLATAVTGLFFFLPRYKICIEVLVLIFAGEGMSRAISMIRPRVRFRQAS
jgi:4-amino-4-deoxy-L-arabinose transferase-like glycosyltransferase